MGLITAFVHFMISKKKTATNFLFKALTAHSSFMRTFGSPSPFPSTLTACYSSSLQRGSRVTNNQKKQGQVSRPEESYHDMQFNRALSFADIATCSNLLFLSQASPPPLIRKIMKIRPLVKNMANLSLPTPSMQNQIVPQYEKITEFRK